jgi:hypothetical protein
MAYIPDIEDLWRRIEGLVDLSGTVGATEELENGEEIGWKITVTNESGARILNSSDISLYVGSIATANKIGWGASVDESQWQIIGPWSDWGSTDGVNQTIIVFVRNISAGTQDVILRAQVRTITNTRTIGTATA